MAPPPPAVPPPTEIQAPLLAATCTVSGSAASIAVADGETLLVGYRSSDMKVTLNANTAGGMPCEVNATAVLTVSASGTDVTLGRTVILDYVNGLFMKGATGVPGIVIDLTVSAGAVNATDTLQVRGAAGTDNFTAGAGTASARALNVNAGSGTGLDALVDVTFRSVETLYLLGAGGDDVVSLAGGSGTGSTYPSASELLGGAGNDTITGGNGADRITGGDGNDVMEGGAGNDTFVMGAGSDGADTVNAASAITGSDTVDYSARTAALSLTIDGATGSGLSAGAEGDIISPKIVNVIAGQGDDTITIQSSSTVAHVVTGGAGADVFTGGAGGDVFDGGLGGDTCKGLKAAMSYASRTHDTTVTLCAGDDAACAADNNDGGQSATNTTGVPAESGTTSDNRINITALSANMTGTVGRLLRLTGFTVAANNDNTVGYPITAVNSASSVTIDVSGNASFDQTDITATSTLTWTLVAEGDNVRCANVIGGSAVDTITGDTRNNHLKGAGGNDVLTGATGDDMLDGEAGNDTIYGGVGNDILVGGDGNDTLHGGDGDDVLQGDAGSDTFNCDGLNASGSSGTAPGPIDFTVDRDGAETQSGCEQ